jgi:hypothetical protein
MPAMIATRITPATNARIHRDEAFGFFDSQQCLNFLPLPQGQGSFLPVRAIEIRQMLTCRPGIGLPANRRRHGIAMSRAQRTDRLTRALSVAMPVLAYICR